MATRTQVLYGNRLYGRVTYEENDDPQFLTANLGDSSSMADLEKVATGKVFPETETMSELLVKLAAKVLTEATTPSDARVLAVRKVLTESVSESESFAIKLARIFAETQASTDARSNAVGKALAETVTLTETRAMSVASVFLDTLTIVDNSVHIVQTKGFGDLVLIKEWIGLKLTRANPWIEPSVIPASFTLFGQPLYGQKLFATTPTTNWVMPASRNRAWTNSDGQNTQEA